MSPVFRHGRLRLYLLKLLDESPRHGYEVIRLLQDRFMGVYAPSPGTIYPRLARLEEEGLVTHDETDGRKVYRITDKGREELHARLDDLNELEEEITASVRDIAREVSEDVRETVRSLREELTWAAREFHTRAHQQPGGAAQDPVQAAWQAKEEARRTRDEARGERGRARDEARRERASREGATAQDDEGRDRDDEGRDRDGEQQSSPYGRWHEHAGRPWGHKDWGDWASWGGWPGGAGPEGCADPRAFRDLERLFRQFSRDLRAAAWQAQAISEDAVHDLRGILDETIDRIRAEVFKTAAAHHSGEPGDTHPGPDASDRPTDTPAE
jgi:DNA-binding PadR family transcriptional regulator